MCYANASPRSQEEIKEDNSSNSYLPHLSVMQTTVHLLETEMHLLLTVLVCVSACVLTGVGACMFFQSRNARLSWSVVFLAE